MHFQRRVLAHVRLAFKLDTDAYGAMSKDEKTRNASSIGCKSVAA